VSARRFPPPWTVEEQPACFVVRDREGQQLAYVYFEDEPRATIRRRQAAQQRRSTTDHRGEDCQLTPIIICEMIF